MDLDRVPHREELVGFGSTSIGTFRTRRLISVRPLWLFLRNRSLEP
jgi:hypothetical protein